MYRDPEEMEAKYSEKADELLDSKRFTTRDSNSRETEDIELMDFSSSKTFSTHLEALDNTEGPMRVRLGKVQRVGVCCVKIVTLGGIEGLFSKVPDLKFFEIISEGFLAACRRHEVSLKSSA